jgi:hypothetical protein
MRLASIFAVGLIAAGCIHSAPPAPPPPAKATRADCVAAFRHVAGILVLQTAMEELGEIPSKDLIDRAVDNYVTHEMADGSLAEYETWCVEQPETFLDCLRRARTVGGVKACG